MAWVHHELTDEWFNAGLVQSVSVRDENDAYGKAKAKVTLSFTGGDFGSRTLYFADRRAAEEFAAAITGRHLIDLVVDDAADARPPVADAALDTCLANNPADPDDDGLSLDDEELCPFDEDEVEMAQRWAKATRVAPHDPADWSPDDRVALGPPDAAGRN